MCLNHTIGLGSDFMCGKEKGEKVGLGRKLAKDAVWLVEHLPYMQEALGSILSTLGRRGRGGGTRWSGSHMKSQH